MKKLIKKSFHRKEKGFTLIELLIVIVIIGILAGILLTVLNPIRQQNRARNATVRASILKVAFAVNAVRAGIGTLPSNSQLGVELENISRNPTTCVYGETGTGGGTNLALDCMFTLAGTKLPRYCAANSEVPLASGGTSDCHMRIISGGDAGNGNLLVGTFRVIGAAFDLNTQAPSRQIFVFDSSQGLLLCGRNTPYAVVSDTTGFTALTTVAAESPGVDNCVVLSE